MPEGIPDYATHYHVGARPPFLNLSDLSDEELDPVLAALGAERAAGRSSRVFGRHYMELRRRTEDKLRRLFVEGGGAPSRRAPHYFVLGASKWYEGLAGGMEAVVVKLADLPPDATSVTYPDSFTAMGQGADLGLHHEPRPYHDTVFRLGHLPDLVARYGLPVDEAGGYEGYAHQPFEKYIEIQLWTDEPVAAHLPPSTVGT